MEIFLSAMDGDSQGKTYAQKYGNASEHLQALAREVMEIINGDKEAGNTACA